MNNNTYGTVELILDGEEISYVLSAIIDLENPGEDKAMESLSFCKNYGTKDEETVDVWDNDHYLYHTLYKNVLVPWVDNKTINDGMEFAQLIQVKGVHIDDFKELKELFDKAIELGFLKDQIEDESDSNK